MSLLPAQQAQALIDPTLPFLGEKFAILPELERGVGCSFGRGSSIISATVVGIRVLGFVLFP